MAVVQFDAHADLRDEYMGEALSHATVIRRVWDIFHEQGGDGRDSIFQFGIRSGCKAEFEWASGHVTTERFGASGVQKAVEVISDRPMYVTIDLDVLDPSEFSGTGTPEAGGMSFDELLDAIMKLPGNNIVGFDLCELSPHYDASGVSTAVACKILREMLIAFSQVKTHGGFASPKSS